MRFARQDEGIVLMAYPFLSLNKVSIPENEANVQHSSSILCLCNATIKCDGTLFTI